MPEDLLESIGQRLASGHDATSFQSACSPWHAAVPFTTFKPLLLLPFDPDSDRVGFYCVPEKKVLSKTLPDVRDKVTCGSSWGVAGAHGRGGVRDAAKSIRQCSCPPR